LILATLILAICPLVSCLIGCGSVASTSFGSPSRPRFLDPASISLQVARFDAVVGRAMVIPVNYTPSAASGEKTKPDLVRVLLDDGTVIPARLYRVEAVPSFGPPTWLPRPAVWRVRTAPEITADDKDSQDPNFRAAWVLLAQVPEGERPIRLRVGNSSFAVRWIDTDDPPRPVSRAIVPDARTTGVPRASILAPEFLEPTRRWRAWLAMRSVRLGPSDDSQRFSDPILEAIAVQREGRWSFALARLAREDRSLCDRLVAVLSATADFGAGQIVPVWPTAGDDAEALLSDLLDPAQDLAARRAIIEAWLGAQRTTVLWVQDDAGRTEADSGKPAGELGILNLGERREIARVDVGERARDGREPVVVDLAVVRRVSIVADDASPDVVRRPVLVRVRVGSTTSTLPMALRKLTAEPPGQVFSPFFEDFTLETWSSGVMQPAAGDDRATVAMLFRSIAGDWVLHFEASDLERSGETDANADASRVRIWLGPIGRDRVIELRHDGSTTGRDAAGNSFEPKAKAVRSNEKWTAMVTLPAECIEPDGVLRVGIERSFRDGSRCAFPRPMLPWQAAPGRVAIDTTGWQ